MFPGLRGSGSKWPPLSLSGLDSLFATFAGMLFGVLKDAGALSVTQYIVMRSRVYLCLQLLILNVNLNFFLK